MYKLIFFYSAFVSHTFVLPHLNNRSVFDSNDDCFKIWHDHWHDFYSDDLSLSQSREKHSQRNIPQRSHLWKCDLKLNKIVAFFLRYSSIYAFKWMHSHSIVAQTEYFETTCHHLTCLMWIWYFEMKFSRVGKKMVQDYKSLETLFNKISFREWCSSRVLDNLNPVWMVSFVQKKTLFRIQQVHFHVCANISQWRLFKWWNFSTAKMVHFECIKRYTSTLDLRHRRVYERGKFVQ